MRLSVHCLGGILKPAGLGDGLKPNSCQPPAQLLLMNRIIPSAQASSIKHRVSSIEYQVSSIEYQVSSISTCFSGDLLLAGVSLIGTAFSTVCSTGSARSAEMLLLLWTLSIIE